MTNKKIRMAKKGQIPELTPIQMFFEAAQQRDLAGMTEAVINMDNSDFEDFSNKMSGTLEKIFSSREYQNNLINQINMLPDYDYQREKEGYDNLVKTIDELEAPENKKDFIKKIIGFSYAGITKYEKDPSEHIRVIFKKLDPKAITPTYSHIGDAGADLYALVNDHITIPPGGTVLIPTGIALKIPGGYEAQIRPRSGMSLKTKIRIANAPGTIDSNYRGEIGIIVDNRGNAPYIVNEGDRIAQLVFSKVPTADFEEGEVDTENDNSRGEKGFGSSGTT